MLRMHINSIAKNQSGGVLVWVALVMTVLLGMVGIAIDYARVYEVKSQLQRAADAAALVVARAPTRETAEEAMTAYVNANTTTEVQGLTMTPTLTSWQVGQAEVAISATVNLTLSAILGSSEIPVSVSSTGAQGFTYLDVYTAVDLSASLGIAADPVERGRLQTQTWPYLQGANSHYNPSGEGCAFACHTRHGWEPWDANGNVLPASVPPKDPARLNGMSTYDFARLKGIKLREDVLDAAFQNFVSTYFSSNQVVTNKRRIDVIGFSNQILDLTGGPVADVQAAQNALSKFSYSMRSTTLFDTVLPQISQLMGSQGPGFTQEAPKKMLVLITDGARSNRDGGTVWPIDEPANGASPANCQAIKNKNITVAVINVQYADLSGNHWFDKYFKKPETLAKPDGTTLKVPEIYGELSNALQQCASPGWYFEASDTGQSGIDAAMAQLIETINKSSLRLAF